MSEKLQSILDIARPQDHVVKRWWSFISSFLLKGLKAIQT